MKGKLFNYIIYILSKVSGRNIIPISKKYIRPELMAVKSLYGFWYAGNVFDRSDIAYGLASNGTVEEFDTNLVMSILKKLHKNYIFYDIGANTGWYSMIASTTSDESFVHSFEPLEEHLKCLKETLFLNQKQNQVTLHEIALSDHNGNMDIKLAGSGSSLEKEFLDRDNGTRNIEVATLDTLTENHHLPLPDFIKIDVEGHEYKVLYGARRIIKKSQPVLFIEIAKTLKKLNRNFTNENFYEIFRLLSEIGYQAYSTEGEELKSFDPKDVTDGVNMYLFLHKENHEGLLPQITP